MSREVPSEVLFDILTRVPGKYVHRFMCVSKEWHSILRSSLFAKMHVKRVTNDHDQNHPKLVIVDEKTPCNFQTIDCESPNDGLTPSRPFPFKTNNGLFQHISIVASDNGLVCLGIKKDRFYNIYQDIVLWNPLTSDYKILSKPSFYRDCYNETCGAFRLYHSSSEDDYKILCVTRNQRDVYMYSLKSDSWRVVDKSTGGIHCISRYIADVTVPSALLNEKLYVIKKATGGSYSIIRFDLKTEKFIEMAMPSFGLDDAPVLMTSLTVIRGHIHLCVSFIPNMTNIIKLWRMDGDGDWEELVTYYSKTHNLLEILTPVHLMRNGNWLIHSSHKHAVYIVDMEKHTEDLLCSYRRYLPPVEKYIETIVSPNQYTK